MVRGEHSIRFELVLVWAIVGASLFASTKDGLKVKGYDTKVMRKVIALRKRDKDDIAEEEAVLEMYKAALGMS